MKEKNRIVEKKDGVTISKCGNNFDKSNSTDKNDKTEKKTFGKKYENQEMDVRADND